MDTTTADQEAGPAAAPRKRRSALITAIVVLVLVVLAVILLFLFRGCDNTKASQSGGSTTDTAADAAAADTFAIENKVYAALRARSLGKDTPLTDIVYIARASVASDKSAAVAITLTQSPKELDKSVGKNGFTTVAGMCQKAVLADVAEITTVTVVADSKSSTVAR